LVRFDCYFNDAAGRRLLIKQIWADPGTRLPEGQWYATKQILVTYPDPERGTAQGGANWNIDVQVLEESDFPPDAFNGRKLLEGAKIETY
jgi:hypothetical protein